MVEGPIQSHQENQAPQSYGFWGKHGRERWYLTVRDAFVESGRSLLKPPFKPMTTSGAIIGGVALGSIHYLLAIPGLVLGGVTGEIYERRTAKKAPR